MITLKADNRTVSQDAKITFVGDNTVSSTTALNVVSTNGFSADDYVLIGDFGQESAEILQVDSVGSSTVLNLKSPTEYAHAESSSVKRVLYDKVRFYRTTTTTFSAGSPLGTVDIDPQNAYTFYEDYDNATGYGWFIFLNSTTSRNSSPSNPIPYVGFNQNSAKSILDTFFSSISNSDAKLITFEEAFRWLNEGYSIAATELNLSNQEYTTETVYPIDVVTGTQEYELPSNFAKLVSVSDGEGADIDYIKQRDIREYLNAETGASRLNRRYYDVGSWPRYYIRENYIGFVPLATEPATYYLYYNTVPGVLTSYYDNVNLPNNNYYCLQDFLKYRALDKLDRPDADGKFKRFMTSINMMKVNSVKQNANRDRWEVSPFANI